MTFRPLVSKRLVAPYFGAVRIVALGLMPSMTVGVDVVSSTAVIDFAGSLSATLLPVAVVVPACRAFSVCETNVSPWRFCKVSVLTVPSEVKFARSRLISCASFSARFTKMTVRESPLLLMEL